MKSGQRRQAEEGGRKKVQRGRLQLLLFTIALIYNCFDKKRPKQLSCTGVGGLCRLIALDLLLVIYKPHETTLKGLSNDPPKRLTKLSNDLQQQAKRDAK